jgi:2-C-methyl-D-erythritol 4-phosphate cytidylyltransferase
LAVALVVAAGRGERLGKPVPKAFANLAGRPMVEWSVGTLRRVPAVTEIVVALPAGVEAPDGTIGVPGGSERSHSVRAALAAASSDEDVVVVHDAARPLVTPELVEACLAALGDADAAIAAAPVTDTIKECADGRVVRTLDRSRLWAVQTPQVFRRGALQRALDQDHDAIGAATDDAALVEAMGGTVRVVSAPRENLKVTTELDLRVAELLLSER